MDDFNVDRPRNNNPVERPDNRDKRVEPPKNEDKDKFSKVVDKKRDKGEDEQAGAAAVASDDDETPTIFSLSRNLGTKKKRESASDDKSFSTGQTTSDLSGVGEEDDLSLSNTDEDGSNNSSGGFDFSQETRRDIFQFISNATQIQGPSFSEKVSTPSSISRQEAFDLANQMIEKITQMKTQGSTSTEVTLKFPPLFEGAKLTVKEFATAKGEFNISFENLTAQAKHMIDMKDSREMLTQTLQERGYNVHIIIATTDIEKPEYKQDLNPQNQQQQQRDQQQQQQQKEQHPDR